MRAILAMRLRIAWFFLTAIFCAAFFVIWKLAILDAPPANSLLISTPVPIKASSPQAVELKARATITALTKAVATLQASARSAGSRGQTPAPSAGSTHAEQVHLPPAISSPSPQQTMQGAQAVLQQTNDALAPTPTAVAVEAPIVPVVSPSATTSLAPDQPASSPGKININTAEADQLELLPGIGPVLAARIIEFRQTNGPFRSPEDIMKVSGIKEGIYGKLRDFITVEP